MIFLYIISFILLLLCWVLLVPVIMRIDSSSHKYRVMLPGVFSIRALPSAEKLIILRVWIFFVPFHINPIRLMNKKTKEKDKPEKKKRKGLKLSSSAGKFRQLPGVVRIRKLEMDLDTDDFIVNAWLVPLFATLNSYRNINLKVNFEGNLALDLDIRTRIGTIIWFLLTNR